LLLPGEFIELAEISGAIDDLTQWVIERAVRDTRRLDELGRSMLVSCNLSVRNLHDRVLLDWLEQLAKDVGLPPKGLYLELTESQIMEDAAGAASVLKRLSEIGIGTAVDDFGTGYSSLSTLLHVSASVLKIDRSFVADLLTTHEAQVMVRSMVDLGHNLGMLVVAEGVEDQATLDRLGLLGCDFIQGFHVARPMPFELLTAFLGVSDPARVSDDEGVVVS
jgi:EAL domain-containing protein (putative c-di-GMP-specific phosphodiesterase class I)